MITKFKFMIPKQEICDEEKKKFCELLTGKHFQENSP
jgi:hypothetical protein